MRSGYPIFQVGFLCNAGQEGYEWSDTAQATNSTGWHANYTLRVYENDKVNPVHRAAQFYAFPVLCPWGLRLSLVRFYAVSRLL